jgi:acetylornithine deacetylase/succinyl-diaminopimelate desuccinylase family protein
MDTIDQALLETLNDFRHDIAAFCARLIQTPSVNGQHPERDLAELIAEKAVALGLHTQLVGEHADRPNVIVSTATEGATGLLLLAHSDTVPPGDVSRWTYPPFSGYAAGGRIYGRGAVDTKGGIAAALYALAALRAYPQALAAGRAQLVCFPDEETGATGELGVKYLYPRGLLNGSGAIYCYSGNQLILGHRGLIRYQLICRGEAAHTGFPGWQEGTIGANAVTGMARLLLALEAVETQPSSAKYFERFRTVITPGTVIKGGVSVNMVPDTCETLVDIRTTPEYTLERMNALIEECIRRMTEINPKLRFEVNVLNYIPAVMSDERAPLFAAVEAATELVRGIKPERAVAGPANEGYLLIERSIPTVCGFGVLGENAHAADEYVEIDSLVEAASIFALTARTLARELRATGTNGAV